MITPDPIHRREFLGSLALSAAGLAAVGLPGTLLADEKPSAGASTAAHFEMWLKKIKGKYRQVFDAPSPNGGLPLAWARVFLMTNKQVGAADKDVTSVLVLRHDAIPLAMNNELWEKYSFGDAFNVTNAMTKEKVTTNIFYKPKTDFPLPGMSLDKLLDDGVLVGVCDMALTFNSMHFADKMKLNAADVKKEWVAGIFPGIQVVPSGVLAINRAQMHGCSYCYAGEG